MQIFFLNKDYFKIKWLKDFQQYFLVPCKIYVLKITKFYYKLIYYNWLKFY